MGHRIQGHIASSLKGSQGDTAITAFKGKLALKGETHCSILFLTGSNNEQCLKSMHCTDWYMRMRWQWQWLLLAYCCRALQIQNGQLGPGPDQKTMSIVVPDAADIDDGILVRPAKRLRIVSIRVLVLLAISSFLVWGTGFQFEAYNDVRVGNDLE